MKFVRILIAAATLATAISAFALSPQHEEWAKGPAKYFMTAEEAAQWKAIKSDEEAEKFIALFWARRDPTPETQANEFRQLFDQRVKFADETFAGPKGERGALTERGKTFVLFGHPTRVVAIENGQSWHYEGDAATRNFGAATAELRFIDPRGGSDFKVVPGAVDYAKAEKDAAARFLVQADLKDVPRFAADGTPAAKTELTTESLRNAVAAYRVAAGSSPRQDGLKPVPTSDKVVHAVWGEYVTASGETFVPVVLYIPKTSGAVPAEVTFFGVVEDASGKSVVAFEQPVKVTASSYDWFVDTSLKLGAGKHRGIFGIAEAGKPIAITSADIELSGAIDKTATGASQLILSNNIFPMTEAQLPTDPFAFGGLKVVPKADKTFRPADELWYFVEMRNPGLTEGETPQPNVQVKLDLSGKDASGKTVKMSAPLMEVQATPVKGVPGHYAVGNSIPLATFKPGEYTFNVKIIDTVKKASYTLSDTFRIVE